MKPHIGLIVRGITGAGIAGAASEGQGIPSFLISRGLGTTNLKGGFDKASTDFVLSSWDEI